MLKLSIQDSEGRSTVVPLSDGELSIGRDEANSICLTDRNVSRQHARLVTKSGHVWVENVAATYGTRFNSLLLRERAEMKKGDLIQVGDYTLELVGEDVAKRDTAMVDEVAKPATPPPASASASASKAKSVDGATAIVNLADIQSMLQAPPPAGDSKAIPDGQQPRLVVESENLRGLELRITKTPIVVGRVREAADLVIDHRSISKEHARLTRMADGGWQVLDLGSANGMKVNGEPYSKCDIRSGDRVELGHVTLRFLAAGAKAPMIAEGAATGGGKSNLTLIIAGAVGVVLIGAAAAFFALRGGKEEKPVVVADAPAKIAGQPQPNAPAEPVKPVAPDAPDKVDPAKTMEQAEKLYKAGMLAEAQTALEGCVADNPGNAQCGVKLKQVVKENALKQQLDDAQDRLENNPKAALDAASEVKAKLKDDSPLNDQADKLSAAAKAALDDAKRNAHPAVAPTPAQPKAEKPVKEAVQRPVVPKAEKPVVEKPPVEVKKEVVVTPAAPVEAKKTGKDMYDEARQKMLQGDTDGAIASFKAATKAGFGKAHGQLARVYFSKGDKGACASAAKSYLDKYPDAGDAAQIQTLLEKCSN